MALSWMQDVLAVLSGSAVGILARINWRRRFDRCRSVPALRGRHQGRTRRHWHQRACRVRERVRQPDLGHWRAGNVKWPCAATFAAAGIIGAAIGSSLGKLVDGQQLLFLFALAMIAVGVAMLRPRAAAGDPSIRLTPEIAVRLIAVGLIVGAISGFFGIGGGFLIVPGIMLGSGMPILNAIGSSLLSVGTFGLTTAANYAVSGFVDWMIAVLFIAGGLAGGIFGMRAAIRLAVNRRMLTSIFAGVIFAVAIYMLVRTGLPPWLSI